MKGGASMKLDEALLAFRAGKPPFSKIAVEIIKKALGGLASSDFVVHSEYVSDIADQFHIHPTMIVSRQEFEGSTNRGTEPYKSYPHFLGLPEFSYSAATHKNVAVLESVCPVTYIRQPAHVVCPTCEILH